MSSSFAPIVAAADAPALDPTKHVLYQLGMVLGVADLSQDFTWLSTRGDVAVRELAGYGTVTGLRVAADVDPRGPRIVVEPGTAYSPKGELIRLCKSQCAYLDDWLLENKDDVAAKRDSSTHTVSLYVVLCYRDCPTDNVPIPGSPCRTEDQAMQPSRLADDFTLEFRWQAPEQNEANAIRGFVHWLHRVKAVTTGHSLTLREFEAELLADEDAILAAGCGDDRSIASPPDSPPGSPPYFVMNDTPIPIPSGHECEYMRAALRIWTTRFRPRIHPDLMAGSCGCGGTTPSSTPSLEGCLLLAEVVVPLARSGTLFVVDRTLAVEVRERCRPALADLQMLQEYILCSLRAQDLPPGNVTPARTFGLPAANGVLDLYARADHSHGTPDLPVLQGEVTGDATKTVVSKILGLPVNPGPTTGGQVLAVSAGAWAPTEIPHVSPGPVRATQQFGLAPTDGVLDTYARADHSHGTPPLPVRVVAAGVFDGKGTPAAARVFGNLTLRAVPVPPTSPPSAQFFTEYQVKFDGISATGVFLIKGTVITPLNGPTHTLERVSEVQERGIFIRVSRGPNEELPPGFSLEISEIAG